MSAKPAQSPPFRRAFVFESFSAITMVLFGLKNIIGADSGLHSIISAYLVIGGIFLTAIAVRRRSGPPEDLPESANGLKKAIEKLAGSKPFGFVCLAITPLPLGFGGAGILVFLMLYLVSVNAMRHSDAELMTWVYGDNVPVALKSE